MSNKTIGNTCYLLNGYAFKSSLYVDNGIRVIRIANVQKGYIEDSTPAFYPLDSKGLNNYMLKDGDLLMSLTGNVGRVALLSGEMLPAVLNQRVACLRLKDNSIDKKFLFHYLNSSYFENKCIQESKGVAQKNMSTEWLKRQEIPFFTLEKQKEISKVLDNISDIVKFRTQQLTEYDELIKSRFVEMFGDENNSRNWYVTTIDDVADVRVGVVITPAKYYTDAQSGVRAFRSLNVGEMYVNDKDWVYFNKEGNEKNKRSILKENDVLIVRSGAPGKSCVVTKEYEGCNAIDVIIAHADESKVNPYYLSSYTNFPHGKNQILEGTGGAAQQHFNIGKYRSMKLMLPPVDLQNEYCRFLCHIDKLKIVVQQSLDETQRLFDSLMQEYFG